MPSTRKAMRSPLPGPNCWYWISVSRSALMRSPCFTALLHAPHFLEPLAVQRCIDELHALRHREARQLAVAELAHARAERGQRLVARELHAREHDVTGDGVLLARHGHVFDAGHGLQDA